MNLATGVARGTRGDRNSSVPKKLEDVAVPQLLLGTWDWHPGIGQMKLIMCFSSGQPGHIKKDCLLMEFAYLNCYYS